MWKHEASGSSLLRFLRSARTSLPSRNSKEPVMLQEGDPGFRGSLEHLGQSTGDLRQAALGPGEAGGWTTCPDVSPCPLHPHSRSRSQLLLLPVGGLSPLASLHSQGDPGLLAPLPYVPRPLLSSICLSSESKSVLLVSEPLV